MGISHGEFMQRKVITILIFLLLVFPYSFSLFANDEQKQDEPVAEATQSPKQESGKGWRLFRSVEMGSSGKFIHLVLIDHSVYTDKTVYSSAINRICNDADDFCRIRFWSEERFIPEKASMSIEQNKQLRAEYLVNKTAGTKQLRWSCTVDTDKAHCF